MGLLDSIVSAVTRSSHGSGGLQDLINSVSQNPQLLEAATSLLGALGSLLKS